MRPIDIIRKHCPHAKANYVSAFEVGDGLFMAHDVISRLRVVHFLAQVIHESDQLTIYYESGHYSAQRLIEVFGVGHHSAGITPDEATRLAYNEKAIFERVYGLGNPAKARELGNTRPGDGYLFRGTGPMQMTGGANFKRIGDKCGVDFYNHPELALDPQHILKPAFLEWDEGKLNDYADRDDILAISRIINIGNNKTKKIPNGYDKRVTWLKTLKRTVDHVEFEPVPPPAPPEPKPPMPVSTAAVYGGSFAALLAGVIAFTASAGGKFIIVLSALAAMAAVTAIVKWKRRSS